MRGGVSSLVRSYFSGGLFQRFDIRYVPTHRDGTAAQKAVMALKAYAVAGWVAAHERCAAGPHPSRLARLVLAKSHRLRDGPAPAPPLRPARARGRVQQVLPRRMWSIFKVDRAPHARARGTAARPVGPVAGHAEAHCAARDRADLTECRRPCAMCHRVLPTIHLSAFCSRAASARARERSSCCAPSRASRRSFRPRHWCARAMAKASS